MNPPPTSIEIEQFDVWPEDITHTQENLQRMFNSPPHYEASWTGDILTTLFCVFPPSLPEYYCHKPQHNLRDPILPGDNSFDQPGPRTSLESHGNTAPSGDSRIKDECNKPDIVIDQGIYLSQKLVALVEIKRSKVVDTEGLERFTQYCKAITRMGPPGRLLMQVEGYCKL